MPSFLNRSIPVELFRRDILAISVKACPNGLIRINVRSTLELPLQRLNRLLGLELLRELLDYKIDSNSKVLGKSASIGAITMMSELNTDVVFVKLTFQRILGVAQITRYASKNPSFDFRARVHECYWNWRGNSVF